MGGLLNTDIGGQGPRLGLLGPQLPPPGLGGGLLSFRDPNEGLMARFFGNPDNPSDPRGPAMMALSAGLIRGDLAGGLEGASRAFSDTENRAYQRMAHQLTLGRAAQEMEAARAAQQREAAIMAERQRMMGARGFAALPNGRDHQGTPTAGGIPLFSMGAGGAVGGAPTMPGAAMGAGPMPGAAPGGVAGYGGGDSETANLYRQLVADADLRMRYGDTKTAMELYQRAESFRPKYSQTPQIMRDPRDGSLKHVVIGEDGTTRVLPFGVKPDISLQDLGGRVVAVDRNAATGGQSWGKTMTPGEAASNSLGWANNRLGRDRLAFEKDSTSAGKAPTGYRFRADGGLEAIPGGPADIKAGELGEKTRSRAQHAVGQAGVVIGAIDEALDKAGFFETGLTGSVVGRVPGTDAYDVRRTVETVKANIGFDNLQRMREMSPTGGALGQVAVQELNALQSTVANLDANQSQDVLKRNLEKVRRHYSNWRKAVAESAGLPLEEPAPPPAAPGALGSGSFGITQDAIAAELARRRGGR